MERNDQIRKEILLQLYAARPLTLTPDRIARDAKKQGYDYTVREIKQELVYLADNGLLIEIGDPGVSAKLYRIHAKGVTHYEQTYAA